MGISEFALHNVLRTYSRQDRLGKVRRTGAQVKPASAPSDQVSLSPTGRKVQGVGALAAEVVDRQHPDIPGDERAIRIRDTKEELLARHEDAILDDSIAPDALDQKLRPLYLD